LAGEGAVTAVSKALSRLVASGFLSRLAQDLPQSPFPIFPGASAGLRRSGPAAARWAPGGEESRGLKRVECTSRRVRRDAVGCPVSDLFVGPLPPDETDEIVEEMRLAIEGSLAEHDEGQ
jgi:hypothetical protein